MIPERRHAYAGGGRRRGARGAPARASARAAQASTRSSSRRAVANYVEQRVRAGVLEQGTVDLLTRRVGRTARSARASSITASSSASAAADTGSTWRRCRRPVITVYGQQEVVKDLIGRAPGSMRRIPVRGGRRHARRARPRAAGVRFTHDGRARELCAERSPAATASTASAAARSRPTARTAFERAYPFAWLGILARRRRPRRADLRLPRPRLRALQHALAGDHAPVFAGARPTRTSRAGPTRASGTSSAPVSKPLDGWREGPILERGVTGMRSFVAEPMQYGRLFLAGDAAHIVPPTGAKGMNLAVADVRVLAARSARLPAATTTPCAAYSATCLKRVWRAEHFSWWMTSMLHRFPRRDGFQHKLQRSQLEYVAELAAAATSLAENYVGLPGRTEGLTIACGIHPPCRLGEERMTELRCADRRARGRVAALVARMRRRRGKLRWWWGRRGEVQTLKVGVIPIADVAPMYVGMEQGLLRGRGPRSSSRTSPRAARRSSPAVLSGDDQIGFSNTTSLIIAASKDLPVQIISQGVLAERGQEGRLGRRGRPRRAPTSRRFADLEGKTVAVNTLNNVFADRRQYGDEGGRRRLHQGQVRRGPVPGHERRARERARRRRVRGRAGLLRLPSPPAAKSLSNA